MDTNTMQPMPQSIRCEQEILGGIFNNPKIIAEIVDEIDIDDFYKTQHQIIFSIICKLFAEGKDINITQFVETIGKDNLKSIGGISYLSELIIGGMIIRPKQYISIIKDKSYRRKVIKEFSKGIEVMYDEKTKAFDVVGKVMNTLATQSEKRKQIFYQKEIICLQIVLQDKVY